MVSRNLACALLGVLTLLTGCVSKDPVILDAPNPSAEQTAEPTRPAVRPARDARGACRIAIAEIVDARADPQMGGLGARIVHAHDPKGWVRNRLEALGDDPKLAVVKPDEQADLELRVEILKIYIESMNTAKSATVVLRVNYKGGATDQTHVYRGVHTAGNWNSSDAEIQSAIGRALDKATQEMRSELVRACPRTGAPH